MKYRLLFCFLFVSCSNLNTTKIDISHINLDVKIERFDEAFFSVNEENVIEKVASFRDTFPDFFPIYISNVLFQRNFPNDKQLFDNMVYVTSNSVVQEHFQEIQKQFSDILPIEEKLTNLYKHFTYFFPETFTPPRTIFAFSGFKFSVFTIEKSSLVICLDRYMGKNYHAYKALKIYEYLREQLDKRFMMAHVAEALLRVLYPDKIQNTLVYQIIAEGKKLYALQQLLPDEEEDIIMRYTTEQLENCQKNETGIWRLVIENNLLFEKNQNEILKYTNDAPFTKGFPKALPGRLLNWVGLQMVKSYMKNYPKTTLKELLEEHNYEKIFNKSLYKPL